MAFLVREYMANRRMFSKKVTNSSEFLMMSQSAQALYFHIGMNADDDGFCELFTVVRMTESKPDDIQSLHSKGFIFIVDGKVCIVKDWYENNFIRPDRYEPSKYLKDDNMAQIHAMATTKTPKQSLVYQRYTEDRLGKDRLLSVATAPILVVKDEPQPKTKADTSYQEVFKIFSITPMGWWRHKPQIEAAKRMLANPGVAKVRALMAFYREHDGEPFMPKIYKPFDLEAKVDQLLAFKERNNL